MTRPKVFIIDDPVIKQRGIFGFWRRWRALRRFKSISKKRIDQMPSAAMSVFQTGDLPIEEMERAERMRMWRDAALAEMLPSIIEYRRQLVDRAIGGDYESLGKAFMFGSAPRGGRFWVGQQNRMRSGRKIDDCAMALLRELRDNLDEIYEDQ